MKRWQAVGATAVAGVLLAGCGGDEKPAMVDVDLDAYWVKSNVPEVAAGKVRFTATNRDPDEVHELAVLRAKDDGQFENMGEVEDLDPLKGGSITLKLQPGKYLLACLIAAGEAGSEVDHLEQGMHQEFTVR